MATLDTCPLCRSVLPDNAAVCPSCHAEMAPYLQLAGRAEQYLVLAFELVARGRTAEAAAIAERVPQVAKVEPELLADLNVRLALNSDNLPLAAALLEKCTPSSVPALQAELQLRRQAQLRAHELYNRALAAARADALPLAAELLAEAVAHDAQDAALWQLKLKADLKCRYFVRCYADLRELDRLNARQPQYIRLERLLPPATPS